jgi:elongation factor P
MATKLATEIRQGNILDLNGAPCKVLFQEIRGTGKFGKTVHLKLKNLLDGHLIEKSLRAEEKAEDVEIHYVTLQYLYREGTQFVFMNLETYEQVYLPATAIGKQEIFLKENADVKAICVGAKPINIEFPRSVELKVISTAPGVKGQADTTYKEAELENGLKILVPQFVKEGEFVRVNTDDLSYLERVTVKSMKTAQAPPQTPPESEKSS